MKVIDNKATVDKFLQKTGGNDLITIGEYGLQIAVPMSVPPKDIDIPTMYDFLFLLITIAYKDGVELVMQDPPKGVSRGNSRKG